MVDQKSSQWFGMNIAAGGGAGAISRTLMAPLERVKVLLQVQDVQKHKHITRYTGIIDCLVRIPKEQGVLAFWRGNGVNVMRIVPNSAIKFVSYDYYKQLAFPDGEEMYHDSMGELYARKMTCGAISGVTTIVPVYPMDLIRTRLTADVGSPRRYKGFYDCFLITSQKEGYSGLYKGLTISLCGIIPYLAISLSLYDTFKQWAAFQGNSFWQSAAGKVLLGSTAAVLSQSIAYPIDTVRRHMQVSGGLGQQRLYSGTGNCIRSIYLNHGIMGFYKGLLANAVRAGPQSGIEYAAFDLLLGALSDLYDE